MAGVAGPRRGRAAARLYISQPSLSNQIHALERALGTDLFVRTSRQVELASAGRTLLEEAPLALAALERAADRARLAGEGITGTIRLGYTPLAGFETLGAILAAVEHDSPNMTVITSEFYSAEIFSRVLAGTLDVGLVLHPEPMRGLRSERLRNESLVLLVGKRHRLAEASSIPLGSLENKTLLTFPRGRTPAYCDAIIAACEQAGFQPRISAFPAPPLQAALARLQAGHEVSLAPASFSLHAAAAEPGIIARTIAQPGTLAEWSTVFTARPIRSNRALPRERATMR
jgi:DNA-binding transcriptional LysR family regulator